MSHSSHGSAETLSSFVRWVLAGLILATIVLGFWGGWLHEKPEPEALPDAAARIAYHTLQLLIGHGAHLDGPLPWPLHVARFLGLLCLFSVGLVAFRRFFRDEMLLLKLHTPWRRNHVVVCGLGDLGLRLALDGRRRGRFVIAIEKQGQGAVIERARQSGVVVIEGDASDAAVLRRVRLARAEFVVAACAHDATNVAIAATVRRLLRPPRPRRRPLVCRLLLRDPELRQRLEQDPLFEPDQNFHVNFSDLHLEHVAARQAFRLNPLDILPIRKDDATLVHLVVVGFGAMGRNLALQAARIGHFANNVCVEDRKIRITVVDGHAGAAVAGFKQRHRNVDRVCQLTAVEADRSEAAILGALETHRRSVSPDDLVTYAVCLETGTPEGVPTPDDGLNFLIGRTISRTLAGHSGQTLVYQSTRSGFAALLPPDFGDGSRRLHAFGMPEDIFSWDTLLHESEDRLARALHEDYAENRRREGGSEKPWDDLSDGMKDSNRHAADHIPIKLRAIGCYDAPIQPWYKKLLSLIGRPDVQAGKTPVTTFSREDILLMAQMEHRRWCAERWLDGWEWGEKTDREKKINKNLVPWDAIPEEERRKDPEQITAIPRVLRSIGRAIYVQDKTTAGGSQLDPKGPNQAPQPAGRANAGPPGSGGTPAEIGG